MLSFVAAISPFFVDGRVHDFRSEQESMVWFRRFICEEACDVLWVHRWMILVLLLTLSWMRWRLVFCKERRAPLANRPSGTRKGRIVREVASKY